jgi:hypothetical protein
MRVALGQILDDTTESGMVTAAGAQSASRTSALTIGGFPGHKAHAREPAAEDRNRSQTGGRPATGSG